VRRYLAHEPVQARGGGVGYRATRFVQRHTGGVALATLALSGCAGGRVDRVVSGAGCPRGRARGKCPARVPSSTSPACAR
jgi:hypothetical protein